MVPDEFTKFRTYVQVWWTAKCDSDKALRYATADHEGGPTGTPAAVMATNTKPQKNSRTPATGRAPAGGAAAGGAAAGGVTFADTAKEEKFCTYCKKTGHLEPSCFRKTRDIKM